jgi:hypothetical protein
MTNILAFARQGFLGDVTWESSRPGLIALAGVAAALLFFAYRGMQRIVR